MNDYCDFFNPNRVNNESSYIRGSSQNIKELNHNNTQVSYNTNNDNFAKLYSSENPNNHD